jgi:hypothetical protein
MRAMVTRLLLLSPWLLLSAVRPVQSGPDWIAEGNQVAAFFGISVADAGDVNGDGYSDVIVGAELYEQGEVDEGGAFLFFGSAAGLSATPDWSAEGNQERARFGVSVSGAGDVNGDGFDDVLVGAPGFDNGELAEGRAYLFLGSASGPSTTPDWTTESNQQAARLGEAVSGAGDVNGDGFDDVLVGAPNYNAAHTKDGRAYLFLVSAGGLSATPDWSVEGNQEDGFFATSLSCAGDVNGDGFDEVIVGARNHTNGQVNEGGAFLYLGSATGPSVAADWTAESDQQNARFGMSVSGAGDVNGDGFDDFLVGAPQFDAGADEGRAFLYLGAPGGPATMPDWTADGTLLGDRFGVSVSRAGDVNGDGFDDVIVGANLFNTGPQADEGRACLFLGSMSGLASTADRCVESDLRSASLGISVSAAGDVDGDGFDDVIVGADGYANGESHEGAALLYLGRAFHDCNANGIDDLDDIAGGGSQDRNTNETPDECEAIGTPYCAGAPNSVGPGSRISALGSAGPYDNDVTLLSKGNPAGQTGQFFFGFNEIQAPFGNGFLCVSGSLRRLFPLRVTDATGLALGPVDLDQPPANQILAGSTVKFQWWYRDPMGGGSRFNLSDALSITFQ